MSVQHMTWAYKQNLEPGTKFVLVTIANFADGSGACYPGQERLSEMTGMGTRTIRRHIQALEGVGLLTREKRYRDDGTRTSDVYQLVTELPAKVADGLPAKTAGSEGETTGQFVHDYRPNSTGQPAKLAGSERLAETPEPPSTQEKRAPLPAKMAAITISRTISKNHQNKPPTPLKKSKAKKPFDPLKTELPEHVSPEAWADFVAHRSEIRKKLTPTATKKLLEKLETFGAAANQALHNSVANGWTGVFEPKDEKPELSKQTGNHADARAAQSATDLLTAIRSRRDA